jgi:hypothetical protein
VTERPESIASNTGILCDGLRAIDLDIDQHALAAEVQETAGGLLGPTLVRSRPNSSRCLLLYCAAEGSPAKITLTGTLGKIEVLGRGQQFVAFGTHPSGAPFRWSPAAPGTVTRDSLPAVSETAIAAFLRVAAPLIEARQLARSPRRAPRERVGDARNLAGLVRLVASANAGARNNLAFWAACRAGEMVAAGMLDTDTAAAVIADAAMRAGLGAVEAERTARSGVRTGLGVRHA